MESEAEHVKGICEKFLANDPRLTSSWIDEILLSTAISDEEGWRTIAEAMKKNATIEDVYVSLDSATSVFSVPAALSLAGALLAHPKLRELHFSFLKFAEFGPIALAVHQNERLNRLEIESCSIAPNMMGSMRLLVRENALETLTIHECDCVSTINL